MNNIKNVIFDIWGVKKKKKTGHWFITNNFWNILDKTLVDENKLKESLKKYLYIQTQNPKNEKEEHQMFANYYYKVLEDIKYPKLSIEIANKIADDCVYNDDKFIFYDDVITTLEKLATQYNLYIISNGWPSSFRVLKNKKIAKYFKEIVISSMYTTTKEENLFNIFLEKYEVNPEESLYIDDRRHILDKASQYNFDLLLMDRKNIYKEENYKIINQMADILEVLK